MAEQLHNSDDAWAALQEELLSDSEFATTVHDMDDEMDMAILSQNDPYYLGTSPTLPAHCTMHSY